MTISEPLGEHPQHRLAGQPMDSLDATATAAYAHLFQALSEPTRLAIVQHLAYGEHRVRDLVDHMSLAQSTVSKHVAFLLECGLITPRPEGRATWYSLAEPELLRVLVTAAQQILHATGTDAVLCSHLHNTAQVPSPETPEKVGA